MSIKSVCSISCSWEWLMHQKMPLRYVFTLLTCENSPRGKKAVISHFISPKKLAYWIFHKPLLSPHHVYIITIKVSHPWVIHSNVYDVSYPQKLKYSHCCRVSAFKKGSFSPVNIINMACLGYLARIADYGNNALLTRIGSLERIDCSSFLLLCVWADYSSTGRPLV